MEEKNKIYHHYIFTICLSFIYVNLWLTTPIFSGTWQAFKFSPQRQSFIQEVSSPPFTFVWRQEIQGEIISQPVTYKNYLYVTSKSNFIYCFDMKTGELLWNYSTSGSIESSPCIYDDKIFLTSTDGNIYALKYSYQEDEDIQPLWIYNTNSSLRSSPIVYKDKLYVISGFPENLLYEISIETGNLLRKCPLPSFGFSSPVIFKDHLVCSLNDGKFLIVDLQTLTPMYTEQTLTNFGYITHTIDDDSYSYIVTDKQEPRILKYNLNTTPPQKIFETENLLPGHYPTASSPALMDDKIIVAYSSFTIFTFGGQQFKGEDTLILFAINKNNGSIVWTKNIGYPHISGIIPTPVIVDDLIYIGSGDGYLYILNSSGDIIHKINLIDPTVAPVCVSNGYLFIVTYNGIIKAYKANTILSIISPDNFQIVSSTANIIATILPQQGQYLLEYKNINESTWNFISSNTAIGEEITLTTFDTTNLVDGTYKLKLTLNNTKYAVNIFNTDNPPRPPSDLLANDFLGDQGNKILLSWIKSPDDGAGGNDVIGYHLFKRTYDTNYDFSKPFKTLPKNTQSYIDTEVTDLTTYYYIIRAFDKRYISINSNEASSFSIDDTQPSAPSNLIGKFFKGKTYLTWDLSKDDGAGANDVKQYWLFRSTTANSFSPYVVLQKGTTHYVDEDITFTTYYYYLKAYDGQNFSIPSNVLTIVNNPPKPPTDLKIKFTDEKIYLSWNPSDDEISNEMDIESYTLFKSTDRNFLYAESIFLQSGATHYFDKEITFGLTYYYFLKSYDGYNFSIPSNIAYYYVFTQKEVVITDTKIETIVNTTSDKIDIPIHLDKDNIISINFNGNKIEIDIPKATLIEADNITVEKRGLSQIKIPIPNDISTLMDLIFEIKLEKNKELKKSPIIHIYYDNVTASNEDMLRIYQLHQNKWKLLNSSKLNKSKKCVTAEINNFSYFTVFEFKPSTEPLLQEEIYVYPNPAVNVKEINFRYKLRKFTPQITLLIFNIAGEIIKKQEIQHLSIEDVGKIHEIKVDIFNMASGNYLYMFEAEELKKPIVKKLAIIH